MKVYLNGRLVRRNEGVSRVRSSRRRYESIRIVNSIDAGEGFMLKNIATPKFQRMLEAIVAEYNLKDVVIRVLSGVDDRVFHLNVDFQDSTSRRYAEIFFTIGPDDLIAGCQSYVSDKFKDHPLVIGSQSHSPRADKLIRSVADRISIAGSDSW